MAVHRSNKQTSSKKREDERTSDQGTSTTHTEILMRWTIEEQTEEINDFS